jgi:hypothetical protein
MSWLFSQALVEAFSEVTCSDGELFAPLSGNPIPRAYLSPDRMTVFSRLSRFGMTFAPLTDTRGEELLTWYRAGFRARTSAPQERAQASRASDPACGARWPASLAKYDPDTSSWRTPQCSLFEDLEPSLETWPRWGSMRNGECWERPMWERRTSEIESGLWPTPRTTGLDGGSNSRNAAKARGMWPTPQSRDYKGPPGLQAQASGGFQSSLPAAVKMWPTPTARDYRSDSASPEWTASRQDQARGKPLPFVVGGTLNPTWVEWLMGWPLGWTDLKPLVTDRSRNALPRRGAG